MAELRIQRGAVALASWVLDSGKAAFHGKVSRQHEQLVVSEVDSLEFVLEPEEEGEEYRLFIGDLPLVEVLPIGSPPGGLSIGGSLFWPRATYFESGRGATPVLVDSRSTQNDPANWRPRLIAGVFVLPTKLGEDSYQRMEQDLSDLAESLLVDLYGKSKRSYDLRLAGLHQGFQSANEELESLESLLRELEPLLDSIALRPSSRLIRVNRVEPYWGEDRLSPRDLGRLSAHGISPRRTPRPFGVSRSRLVESFDVPEHRALRVCLDRAHSRAEVCARAAGAHKKAIEADQSLRDVIMEERPSLYVRVDLPRIRKLEEARRRSKAVSQRMRDLQGLSFLRGVAPAFHIPDAASFQRSPEYEQLIETIRRYMRREAIWDKRGSAPRTAKLSSRLFEQWVFLRIVESFRCAGLELRDWDATLSQRLRSHFVLDFDRGLWFEGAMSEKTRLRISYEPWILPEDPARQSGATLCRAGNAEFAWSPDIVVEVLEDSGPSLEPLYVVVLDCKYTTRITDLHWADVSKYMQIRAANSMRQVVRQLWLVRPGTPGIVNTDPGNEFGSAGPSRPAEETMQFELRVDPATALTGEERRLADPVRTFATGTMAFFRHHLL